MNLLKKITMITLPLILLISCATGSDLKDGIKKYRMESFSVYDGSENLIQTISIKYNEMYKPSEIIGVGENGITLNRKLMEYTDSGKLSYLKNSSDDLTYIQTEYEYDLEDFLIEVRTVNEKDTLLGSSIYINDEKGNPIEWISEYSSNRELIHFVMEYDDADHLLKSSELDKLGNVLYFSTSEYDETGNEVSYSIYSPEGVLDQQLKSYYKGEQLIRTEILDESARILFRTEYELDEMDKPILISSYNQYDDLTGHVVINYDENGNELIRESFDFEGKLTDKIVREYDTAGNNITLRLFNSDDKIITTTRNSFVNEPLHMEDEEFNTLIFKL
jgi:hypothetical protein